MRGEDKSIKQKLSSRIAYYLNILLKEDYNKIYDFIKNAYKIRSEIAHNYESSYDFEQKDNALLIELLDITRKSIILYLQNNLLFTQEKLKNLNIDHSLNSI